jgi:serine/threonine-protein kinase
MTNSHPTVFRRTASADAPTPGSSFGLAPELVKKARARVRWFAFAMLIMSLIGAGFTVAWHAMGVLGQPGFFRQLLIFGANSAVAATIWWVARTPRFGDSLVLTLGLVMEVLICLGAAIGTNMGVYEKLGAMAEMSWVTPIIILFPLIIPYPPRRMLVASLITACTEPASVLFMWFTLPITRDPMHFEVAIYPLLAAGLAYYASRIIWNLNVEVTRARRLGSCQLEARLGRGGMGEVWRASHQMLARPAMVGRICTPLDAWPTGCSPARWCSRETPP